MASKKTAKKTNSAERQIGDIVVIQQPTSEQRVDSSWTPYMDANIGKVGIVVMCSDTRGYVIVPGDSSGGWWYVYSVLKPASGWKRKKYYKAKDGEKV